MAESGSKRSQKSKNKKIDAGLSSMYLMVHPDDKGDIRAFADDMPKTKAIKDKLKREIT